MKTEILFGNVQMDAQVTMNVNGDINIWPEAWEAEKAPIMPERRVAYRGRITLMEDGQTEVKRYHIGSQLPLYRKLFSTEHCDIIRTQGGQLIERWRFKKNLSIHQVCDIRRREQPAVEAFFVTLKEGMARVKCLHA